jgi:hypothetical protein
MMRPWAVCKQSGRELEQAGPWAQGTLGRKHERGIFKVYQSFKQNHSQAMLSHTRRMLVKLMNLASKEHVELQHHMLSKID